MRRRALLMALPMLLSATLAVTAGGLRAQTAPSAPAGPDLVDGLDHLAREWARINYQLTDQNAQDAAMKALAAEAGQLVARFPQRAEPLTWQAIILCSQAGFEGGLGAYHLVQTARALLDKAAGLDYRALGGQVPLNLGVLYYKVPSFPIGFGSLSKARRYLEDAMAMSPDGLDTALFYGEFLSQQGEDEKAIRTLKHGLQAPPIPGQPVWDAGRRAEIRALLAEVEAKAKEDAPESAASTDAAASGDAAPAADRANPR